jgi:hypothetical protein
MELEQIQRKIYEIRGFKVILDFDLAYMYEVETRVLNQTVKRNMKRFPNDFMFQLTKDEFNILISQFVTSSWGGTRKLPYAFTEQGIAMLSRLLNSDIAINTNIVIMRAFVMLRQYALNYAELNHKIEKLIARLDDNDVKTNEIFELLKELLEHKKELEKPRNPIGFRTGANS